MIGIYLDPFFLAFMNDEFDQEEKLNFYLNEILELDELLKNESLSKTCNFSTLIDCEKILNLFSSYPQVESVEKVIKLFDIKHITPRDVIYTISGIIKLLNTVETESGIDDLLCEGKLDLDEGKLSNIGESKYLFLEKLFAYICILNKLKKYDKTNQFILSKLLNLSAMIELYFELNVTLCEPDDKLTLPYKSKSNFFGGSEIAHILDFLTSCRLWKNGGYKTAIENELSKNNLSKFYSYKIGDDFISSCKATGFLQEDSKVNSLLRSIIQLISNTQPKKTHELRVNKKKGAKKLKKTTGEIAYKRDVDYEYHILYWQLDSNIEFSKVAVHNDNKII